MVKTKKVRYQFGDGWRYAKLFHVKLLWLDLFVGQQVQTAGEVDEEVDLDQASVAYYHIVRRRKKDTAEPDGPFDDYSVLSHDP